MPKPIVYHASLLMASLSLNNESGIIRRSPEALQYLAMTYRCINRDLEKEGTPSDPTMAVVVSLAVHENLLAHFGVSGVHLRALDRMLKIRGGIEGFSSNWVLWHKICRADADRSFHEGCKTFFYQDSLPALALESATSLLSQVDRTRSASLANIGINLKLETIVSDMLSFCRLLNRDPTQFGIEPEAWQSTLLLFAYRLLQLYPLDEEPPKDGMDHVLHLALICFLTTILFEYGRMHTQPYDLLAERLRNTLYDVLAKPELKQQPAILWTLFVGRMALFGSEDDAWLEPYVRSTLSALNIETWDQALMVLSQLPWVGVIHNRRAQRIYQHYTRRMLLEFAED
jgi:hypothetical protein